MFSNHFNTGRLLSRLFGSLSHSKLFSGVITAELLQQELFSVLETDSWFDTLSCLLAYIFILWVLAVTLFVPLLLSIVTMIFL